jgi:shikimate kinase
MKSAVKNVYLIGPMGSGKTTIGRRLAAELGLEFHDCDRELEAHTGASVNLIFDIEGEAGFRTRESKMLETLARKKNVLVATGGGSVLSAANRKILRRSGTVIYLATSVEQQLKRLRRDKSRPLLSARDREAKLRSMALERDPLYESVADIQFRAGSRSIHASTAALAELVRDCRNQQSNGQSN